MYRFEKFEVHYKSILPTAINGLYIAYIDTDPSDEVRLNRDANQILRLARSHQGSVQGTISKQWKVSLPIRDDDQFFFIGDEGDVRLRKMGTLYIFQVGKATRFDGTVLEEELAAGALNIHWTVRFMNPQLRNIDRVFDAITQKDMLRVYKNVAGYRSYTVTSPASNVIGTSSFRQANIQLHPLQFGNGKGSYAIWRLPVSITVPQVVKGFHSFARPYSDKKYLFPGSDIYTEVANGILNISSFTNFMDKAFGVLKTGISVAKEIYDVAQIISSLFLAGTAVTNATTVTIDDNNDNGSLPVGQNVVYWDGVNKPLIQDIIEYEDNGHATNNIDVTYTVLLISIWLGESSDEPVEPRLPFLPKG